MRSQRGVIGTRGSALALWQTQYVVERFRSATTGLDVQVRTLHTQGDLLRDRALSQVGGCQVPVNCSPRVGRRFSRRCAEAYTIDGLPRSLVKQWEVA